MQKSMQQFDDQTGQTKTSLSELEFAHKSVRSYVKSLEIPVLIAIVFESIFLISFDKEYVLFYWLEGFDYRFVLPWIVEVFVFIYITFRGIRTLHLNREQLVVQNILAGILIGFLFALIELIYIHSLWTVFNVVTRPLMSGAIGAVIALVSWFVFIMARKKS